MSFDVRQQHDMAYLARLVYALTAQDLGRKSFALALNEVPGAQLELGEWTIGATPAWVAFTADQQLVILVSGASTPTQGAAIVEGATLPRITVGAVSCNAAIAITAVRIARIAIAQVRGTYTELVLAGHSYGGGIVQVMGAYLFQIAPLVRLQMFSTGAPRVADESLARVIGVLPCVRVMSEGDPIARFPPHFQEAPFANIAVGWPGALYFSEYVQGPGGLIVDTRGTLRPATVNPLGYPNNDPNLLLWLQSAAGVGHREHNLATYVERLTKGIPPPGPPPPLAREQIGPEIEVPLSREVFNRGPVAGPPVYTELLDMAGEQVYIPRFYRPNLYRINEQWQVFWLTNQIATAPTKSKANTIRKYLYKFIRIVQNTSSLNVVELKQALDQYYTAQTDPASEIRPTLQVTL